MADAAKRCRTAAKSRFTRIENKIKLHIEGHESLLSLTILYDDISKCWLNLEEKHNEYVAQVEQDEDNWINEMEDRYFDIRLRFMEYKKKKEKGDAMDNAINISKGDEGNFCELCAEVEKSISKKEPVETVLRRQKQLLHAFDELKQNCNKLFEISSDEKHLKAITSKAIDLSSINDKVDKYIKDIKAQETSRKSIHIEKLPLPRFDGNIRNYPRFKKDFVDLVLPQVSPLQAAFTLRQCLPKDIESYLTFSSDEVDEMIKRLDEKFGDSGKLVEAVVSEIRRFRKIRDDDSTSLIKFVDVVERGYTDLKKVEMESELCNANIISIVESKLPRDIGLEWYRLLHRQGTNIQRTDKFLKLLEYLKVERNALEYSLSDIRTDVKRSFRDNRDGKDDNANLKVTGSEGKMFCWLHDTNDHSIEHCRFFLSKSNEERVSSVREKGACWCCLGIGHHSAGCSKKVKCTHEGCKMLHHPTLHEAHAAGISFHTKLSGEVGTDHCLLLVMGINTGINDSKVNVMWDTAATLTLITFEKAQELQLKGRKIDLTITKTGGCMENVKSLAYDVPLKDKNGRIHWILAYGLNKISTYISSIEVDGILSSFPMGINKEDVSRPQGEVDVLLGLDYAAFHPRMMCNNNHLVLYENIFGKCLGGTHPELREETRKLISHAYVNHVASDDFFRYEAMGIECKPHCCCDGKCRKAVSPYTLKEERELSLIKSGLTLKGNVWEAKYPWVESPSELPDNYRVALAMLISTEKRLLKKPDVALLYQQQMQDMMEKNYARKISNKELKDHKGAIHYICHHEVMRPDSSSTPCRIVFNSSKNFHGHVLNNYWAKGPDLINNLLGVLLRFREDYVAFVGDIRKMYHTVKISYVDQHTHRFLWRDLNCNSKPEIYAMNVVSFGDKPAGTITMVALRETALLCKERYPVASQTLLENIYVDDILDSASSHTDAQSLTEDIDDILKMGSFKVKGWTLSGGLEVAEDINADKRVLLLRANKEKEYDVEIDIAETQKVLGMNWNSHYDFFLFKVRLNFSKKIKNIRSGPDLKRSEVPKEIPQNLTKRMILSQINGFYDPLGLASAFTVKSKILWRNLWTGDFKDKGWDEPIPDEHRKHWENLFLELFDMEEVTFPRCLKPDNVADELPVLVLFSDGSLDAFGACAYIRWKLVDGSFTSRLIAAKCRVAPVKRITIVRLEMNGAVIAKRLKSFIEEKTRIKFSRTYFLVDSEIVLAMLQRESYGFSTYIGLRIGEIQQDTKLRNWHWIDGQLNIADWVTKGRNPKELNEQSIWQNGPDFLKLDESLWPIKQKCNILEIPERIRTVMLSTINVNERLADRIRIEHISRYLTLIRVTARILSMYEKRPIPSLANACLELETSDYQKSVSFWVRECQSQFSEEDMKEKYINLGPQKREDGIWVVGTRASKWIEITYNNRYAVLLPYKHMFSKLYAVFIHNISHPGVASTVSKIRQRFWIVNLHRMAQSIVYKCVPCLRKKCETINQIMGKLPEDRLMPAPAWFSTALDYFGPYEVKGEVNKRARKKCYGVLFNCLATRAVYIDIATDYSTDSFLLVLRRFVSISGYPGKLYSDNGPQLLSASKQMKKILVGLDWDKIKAFGAEQGTEWSFTSADSPWQNGCSEALIKSSKRSINHAIGSQVLSYAELQTVFFEVANILNERPIGRHPTDPESYLCPNDLLLGRATSRVPSGPFKEFTNQRQRFEFVQKIVDSYWKKMVRDYFPSLLVQKKWHTKKRNIRVGDIVIVQDSNAVRGDWRLAKVSKVKESDDGCVRNCELQYKQISPKGDFSKKFTTIQRSVQRIVVLVPLEDNNVND